MVIKLVFFCIYCAFFGVVILPGEIALNKFGAIQGGLDRIDNDERADMNKLRSEFVERAATTERFLEPRLAKLRGMEKRNQQKLENKESLAYVFSMNPDLAKIDSARAADDKWFADRENIIRQKYADQRERVGGWSIMSLAYAMPCLAFFLSIFGSWVKNPRYEWAGKYGLHAAFVAQGVSCIITFNAVQVQQHKFWLALSLSIGAFVCIPWGHALAGSLWDNFETWWSSRKTQKPALARRDNTKPIALKFDEATGSRPKARKIKDSLPMPDNLEDAKMFLRLIILNDEYDEGDASRIAERLGLDWKNALRRTYDKAQKDYESMTFEQKLKEVNRLAVQLKAEVDGR